MRFSTQFSTYEIDPVQRLIRRLKGTNDPTERQGPDGEWKEYHTVSLIIAPGEDRLSLMIHWDERGRSTITSQIVDIEAAVES